MKLKLISLCIAIMVLGSCVMPAGSSSTGNSANSNVAFIINGNSITVEEMMKHPALRSGIEQLVLLDGLWSMVAAQGITIDESIIETQMDEMKQQAKDQGRSFREMMEELGTTEADFIQNQRINSFWEKLLEARLDYTEDDLKAMWEGNPQRFVAVYGRENNLTDSEKDALEFEDVRDTIYDVFKTQEFGEVSRVLQAELIDNANFSIPSISDSAEKQYFEDLLVNRKKSSYVEPEMVEEAAEPVSPEVKEEDTLSVEPVTDETADENDDEPASEE